MSLIKKTLSSDEIAKVLPHAYPFLLVDRVLDCDEKAIVALKNVTVNEPFFQGHFPSRAIMPGVLQIEAMAQSICLWAYLNYGYDYSKDLIYFMGVDEVKFRRPVTPGDQLVIEGEGTHFTKARGTARGVVKVDGKVVTEAIIKAAIRIGGIEEWERNQAAKNEASQSL